MNTIFEYYSSVVGGLMKYLLSNSRAFTVSIRSCRTVVLPLFFCGLLLGCDSHSASVENSEAVTKTAVMTQTITDEVETTDTTMQEDESAPSLLEAANANDEKLQTARSPMIAEKRDDSALQATLIGDYIGMLPCSSCDGITLSLNLYADGSIKKTSDYKNPQTPPLSLVENGIYRQDDNIITIVYEDKEIETYIIKDNHLIIMENKTPNADYTLSRK